MALAITGGSITPLKREKKIRAGYRRSIFGWFIHAITGNPFMPIVSIVAVGFFVITVFGYFGENSKGVEFFVTTEPERANAYVRARGNLSLEEKDRLLKMVEDRLADVQYIESTFAFAGEGGLTQNTGGASPPIDTIGQVQIELVNWSERPIGSGQGILDEINNRIADIPGIQAEVTEQAMGPASGKPLNLRLKGEDWEDLLAAAEIVRNKFEATVRLPEQDRILSTIDTLRVRTSTGLIPLSNFITRTPVPKLGQIDRADTERYFDVKSDVNGTLFVNAEGEFVDADAAGAKPLKWFEEDAVLPKGVTWKWEGDQEDQEESGAFLVNAFIGALGLMFVILLAQFNSIYNSVLVLLAVILSTTGVLIGMLVMDQTFSIIMTGTGIVALAGIVVNNNIVLIDTYQEYARYMPRLQAIVRTAEDRIRPVLLTTITTMAGLAPMMYGLGIATVLTLVFTPSMLAFRVWISAGAYGTGTSLGALFAGATSTVAKNRVQRKATRKLRNAELTWGDVAFWFF